MNISLLQLLPFPYFFKLYSHLRIKIITTLIFLILLGFSNLQAYTQLRELFSANPHSTKKMSLNLDLLTIANIFFINNITVDEVQTLGFSLNYNWMFRPHQSLLLENRLGFAANGDGLNLFSPLIGYRYYFKKNFINSFFVQGHYKFIWEKSLYRDPKLADSANRYQFADGSYYVGSGESQSHLIGITVGYSFAITQNIILVTRIGHGLTLFHDYQLKPEIDNASKSEFTESENNFSLYFRPLDLEISIGYLF